MPEIGIPELLIVLVSVLLLFGPGKAAQIGKGLGEGLREFRRTSRDATEQEGDEGPDDPDSSQAAQFPRPLIF